jgi:hypothetical protein
MVLIDEPVHSTALIFRSVKIDGSAEDTGLSIKIVRPLHELVPGEFGRYNFPIRTFHLNVDYFKNNSGIEMLRVISINGFHPLTEYGVSVGDEIHASFLNPKMKVPTEVSKFISQFEKRKMLAMQRFFKKRLNDARSVYFTVR